MVELANSPNHNDQHFLSGGTGQNSFDDGSEQITNPGNLTLNDFTDPVP